MRKFDEDFMPIFERNVARVVELIKIDMHDGHEIITDVDFLVNYISFMAASVSTTLVMSLLARTTFDSPADRERLFNKMVDIITQSLLDNYAEEYLEIEKIH